MNYFVMYPFFKAVNVKEGLANYVIKTPAVPT